MISSSRPASVQTEAGPSIFFFFNLAQTPLANSLNYVLLFYLFYLSPPRVDPPALLAAHVHVSSLIAQAPTAPSTCQALSSLQRSNNKGDTFADLAGFSGETTGVNRHKAIQ